MSFHATSVNIRLENGHILRATAQTADGDWHESQIDLDNYIGNSNGSFKWDGVNFSHSAYNISIDDCPDGCYLEADLPCEDGSDRQRQRIKVSERIENRDGNLTYRP